MSQKQAGGIFASSFVAGLLLAAAVFAPRAWEPVPGPYFGLDEQASDPVAMKAAHAALSTRKQTQSRPDLPGFDVVHAGDPVRHGSDPLREQGTRVEGGGDASSRAWATELAGAPLVAMDAETPAQDPRAATAVAPPAGTEPTPPRANDSSPTDAPAIRPAPASSQERLALAETRSGAARAAQAAAVPTFQTPGSGAAPPMAAISADTKPAAPLRPQTASPSTLDGSIAGLIERVRPTPSRIPHREITAPEASASAEPGAFPATDSAAAGPTSDAPRLTWSQAFAHAPPIAASQADRPDDATPDHEARRRASVPGTPLGEWSGIGSLGAAPLPGEPWSDPDRINWSDALAPIPPPASERKRGWLGDWRSDTRGPQPRTAELKSPGQPAGGRLFDRIRGGDRRGDTTPQASSTAGTSDASPPDIGAWPRAVRLEQQLDQLTALAAGTAAGGEPVRHWSLSTRTALQAVAETRGPRDPGAEASLIQLGETVLAGMSLADSTVDTSLASHTRRAALAAARRVAVWRSAASLFASLDRAPAEHSTNDAGAAMAKQAAVRTVVELARLLDGIERFEANPTAAEATAVKASLGTIRGYYPTFARGMAKAVEDHYLAPNVRIAVHREFLERLLPGATVDTARFHDTVLGRDVRGTRTVERTTMLRFVPDDDEICVNLEIHGEIASRAVTDAGPVSVTARSASEFVVYKPIKISPQGLIFGDATGVASNRSRVDNIQTSFDSVPVMGSVVRNMARNQQADSMPEANREVIEKIVTRACREVDAQAEPQFAQIADKVRDRVWMPLVRLGLEPTAVGMQTTASTATMRLRLAGEAQLAAHTPRPRAAADAMLSLQLHESSPNNVFDRLGIAGRRLTLEELIRLVCSQVGAEPRIPDDLPDDVTVAFAKEQPLRVECRDGLVHVHVSLDAIESGRRDWYDVVAHVAYKPVCSGQQVYLEREGPIQLRGKGHEGRMEIALRTIFGKIFPKERPVPVLPEKIVSNPRLTDIEAVQAVSSDGWLAFSLERSQGASTTTVAPKQPASQRQGDTRRKIIFR